MPLPVLLEEDWDVLATYRRAVEDMKEEEARRHG